MGVRLQQLSGSIEERLGVGKLLALASLVFVVSVIGAYVYTDNPRVSTVMPATTTSTPSSSSSSSSTVPVRAGIPGFSPVAFTITPSGGQPVAHCGLLAETPDQLGKGLMGQHDLGGYDAMIFHFTADSDAAFYMANVPVPLSIAWYDGVGTFVSGADMPVCAEADNSKCPRYRATGPFRDALETLSGGSTSLGATAGSAFAMGGSCA